MAERLYLDHAATTPIRAEARDAMAAAFEMWANPSSPHADGRMARAMIEEARAQIVQALGWKGALIFTSGASEALAIALGRGKAKRRLVSAVEHDAVMRAAPTAEHIPVDANGLVTLPTICPGDLLAIQSANSETGVLQPLDRIAGLIRAAGGLLLADCAQTGGKLPLPDADFIVISAHKLGGPPGIGALLVRDLTLLEPSGGQEQGYRTGTENLPAIMGFAAAIGSGNAWMAAMSPLRQRLETAIVDNGGEIVASNTTRIPTIGAYRMPGVVASAQLIQFDLAGISVSAGSACSSGSMKTSHVLTGMQYDPAKAGEVIRVSFGPQTKADDINRFMNEWRAIAARAKRRAA